MNSPFFSPVLRGAFRLFWVQTDRYAKRGIGAALAIIVTASVVVALVPIFFQKLIDAFGNLGSGRDSIVVGGLLAIFIGSQFGNRMLQALRNLMSGKASQRMFRLLKLSLFKHIFSLPLRHHLQRKTGGMVETLNQGLQGFHTLLEQLVYSTFPIVVQFLTIASALLYFQRWLYLVIFAVAAVCYVLAFRRGASNVVSPSQNASTAQVEAEAMLTESIMCYEQIKALGMEEEVAKRLDVKLAKKETAWGVFLDRVARNDVLMSTIFCMSMAVALGRAAYEVINRTMTAGEFVMINTYMMWIIQPLEIIGYAIRDLAQGLAFIEKMLALSNEKPEEDSEGAIDVPPNARGEITFDNVCFSYAPDKPGVSRLTFKVKAGQKLAIVGESGSGKTTALRLLSRLCEPDSGTILLDGAPISNFKRSSWRSALGVVPQESILFDEPIATNIACAKPSATREEIVRAANMAHLQAFVPRLFTDQDEPVGERGSRLSGGEKQRISLARAAIKNPLIYVFDEPTASLDSRVAYAITRNFKEVAVGHTMVVVAHQLMTVMDADLIIVLHNGMIVERGTHTELLALEGRYAELWQTTQNAGAHAAMEAVVA